ncbi:hypothetical protein IFM89_037286 [Coptis chinensis]|uniref:DUF2921 domain-containing protein n=1 Tax=Coptis chinensis TaxID=261450 RepID=A0A835I8N5_9MAGN|nr:hypothetical protein IFM89_037286 [Coptis chinensis]
MDYEIQINIQFRPLNSKSSSYVKGTIESTRRRLDPFYFEKLQLFAVSLSTIQVVESVWRVDLEISMVLISNTLICIFVGLQVFYVKKNPVSIDLSCDACHSYSRADDPFGFEL